MEEQQQQQQQQQQPGASPGSSKGGNMNEKRDLRDLNTRLQMYIRSQSDKKSNVSRLQKAIATQEIEFRKKLKQTEKVWSEGNDKLRKENESLNYSLNRNNEELGVCQRKRREFEERVHTSEARCTNIETALQARDNEISLLKQETEQLRKQFANIKYKYDSYGNEKESLSLQITNYKTKNENLMREMSAKSSDLRNTQESFQRLLCDKNEEIESCKEQFKRLEVGNNECQLQLRQEFDSKLAEFVQKREEQYKQEKDEWMRIFKEEFNRKLRSFKEANFDLSHTNKKQEEEIAELRLRVSKLKQTKTELEISNRNLEEETDKIRGDLDTLRCTKDDEIRSKSILINNLRDKYKALELRFDELAGIKLQLDSEINLYKRILDEAENAAGYTSPLVPQYQQTLARNTRKRRRLNNTNKQTTTGLGVVHGELGQIVTPGLARGARIAREDLTNLVSDMAADAAAAPAAAANDDSSSSSNNNNNNNHQNAAANANSNHNHHNHNNNNSNQKANQSQQRAARNRHNDESGGGGGGNDDEKELSCTRFSASASVESDDVAAAAPHLGGSEYGDENVNPLNDSNISMDADANDPLLHLHHLTAGGGGGSGGHNGSGDDNSTPFELCFSSFDFDESLVEISNPTQQEINLKGYIITNIDNSASFQLPSSRTLMPNEKMQIFIGTEIKYEKKHSQNLNGNNQPNPSWLYWEEDVWMGESLGGVRLFDAGKHEISKIEISPDMLSHEQHKGCFVM